MKLLTIPKKNEMLDKIDKINGLIVGLKNFSVTYDVKLTIEEIKKLRNQTDKEIYVVINKPIFNDEIEQLKEKLTQLDEININGIFFYDQAILSLAKKLNIKIPLIWNQTHMVTNYNTCNYYHKKGVYGALLANEITLKEMIEIKKNTDIKIFANIIFRPVMSFTRRTLLTNYFMSMGRKKNNDELEIYEHVTDKKYLVKEEDDGTSIIYSNIINGIKPLFEMLDNDFDYVIIDASAIDNLEIINIVNEAINNKNINRSEVINKVNDIIGEDTGFFYKETIYKVK